ncbi:MAG TPA: winged helix-turn-helix domain-containing protein [Nitrososphaeraceae archaeon]
MKYRSRSDIIGLILEAANGGASKTSIMYKAFLTFTQMREYLGLLIQKELIEYEEGLQKYRTTEKGMRVLQMCNQINEELVILEKVRTFPL